MDEAERGKRREESEALWPPIDLNTPLADLVGIPVVVATHLPSTSEQLMVLQVSGEGERVNVRQAVMGHNHPGAWDGARADMTLANFLSKESDLAYVHALRPPEIKWPQKDVRWPAWLPVTAALLAIGLGAGAAFREQWWALAGVIIATFFVAMILRNSNWGAPRLKDDGGRVGTVETLSRFRDLPRPETVKPLPAPGPDPRERANQVKTTYGALLGDVVYRIENSALFDPAVEESRAFQLLLMRWDDESAHAGDASLATLARELEISFDAARLNAERLGMKHLPTTARPDAERALGSLRLAESATTDGERQAALEAASRLLASLALYYLPTPDDTPALPPPPPPPAG